MGGSASLDHYALKLCPTLLLGTNPRSPAATHGPAHLWQSQNVHSPCSHSCSRSCALGQHGVINDPCTSCRHGNCDVYPTGLGSQRGFPSPTRSLEALNGVSVWEDSSFEGPWSMTTFPTHSGPWTNTPIIRDAKISGLQSVPRHHTVLIKILLHILEKEHLIPL